MQFFTHLSFLVLRLILSHLWGTLKATTTMQINNNTNKINSHITHQQLQLQQPNEQHQQ